MSKTFCKIATDQGSQAASRRASAIGHRLHHDARLSFDKTMARGNLLILLAVLLATLTTTASEIINLTPASAVAHIEASAFDIIIDVRSSEAYQVGHVPGALLVDRNAHELLEGCEMLKVAFYCWGAPGAQQAAETWANHGFTQLYTLGGLGDLTDHYAGVATAGAWDGNLPECSEDSAVSTTSPTTQAPTTRSPTTRAPTVVTPTREPTEATQPTTEPTTLPPTTTAPTTSEPTTRPPTPRPTALPTRRSENNNNADDDLEEDYEPDVTSTAVIFIICALVAIAACCFRFWSYGRPVPGDGAWELERGLPPPPHLADDPHFGWAARDPSAGWGDDAEDEDAFWDDGAVPGRLAPHPGTASWAPQRPVRAAPSIPPPSWSKEGQHRPPRGIAPRGRPVLQAPLRRVVPAPPAQQRWQQPQQAFAPGPFVHKSHRARSFSR